MNDDDGYQPTEPQEERPLWLPPGSVRAILAFEVVSVTLWMWGTGRSVTEGQTALAIAALGAYFVIRPAVTRAIAGMRGEDTKTAVRRMERKLDQADIIGKVKDEAMQAIERGSAGREAA